MIYSANVQLPLLLSIDRSHSLSKWSVSVHHWTPWWCSIMNWSYWCRHIHSGWALCVMSIGFLNVSASYVTPANLVPILQVLIMKRDSDADPSGNRLNYYRIAICNHNQRLLYAPYWKPPRKIGTIWFFHFRVTNFSTQLWRRVFASIIVRLSEVHLHTIIGFQLAAYFVTAKWCSKTNKWHSRPCSMLFLQTPWWKVL